MNEQFARALALGIAQAVALQYLLAASPDAVWLAAAIGGLTPLLSSGLALSLEWRVAADAALDAASLLLPALAFRLSACVGSLTAATLFRSLALVYNAALTRRLERTPEALALSAALFALTALRRDECRETSLVAAAGVAALLLAATLCGVVLGVRQEERRTWRSVYVLRVPLFGALLLAFGAGAPRIDLLALYTLLSALSAHSVIAYNAAVAYDSYAATRLLAVRRLASVGLGVLLEQYGLAPALFAAAIGGAATLSDLGARLWAREAPPPRATTH